MRLFSNRFAQLLAALIAGQLTSGCGLMFAEVEEPMLCETSTVDVPAASAGHGSYTIATDLNLPSDVGTLRDLGFKSDFNFSIEFRSKDGMRDLSFIDSTDARIEGEDGSCHFEELVRFERAATTDGSLTMPSNKSVDLVPCLGGSNLKVQTTFAGNLPTSPWAIDVKVCLSGKARIDLNSK